jgi:hypothetical protein
MIWNLGGLSVALLIWVGFLVWVVNLVHTVGLHPFLTADKPVCLNWYVVNLVVCTLYVCKHTHISSD